MATVDEKAYRADQMGLLLTSEGWQIATQKLREDLDRYERMVLKGDHYKTYDEYKYACGLIEGLRKALRYPHDIRKEAGVPLPASYREGA
jgi:type I site-specific restriction endonuclease